MGSCTYALGSWPVTTLSYYSILLLKPLAQILHTTCLLDLLALLSRLLTRLAYALFMAGRNTGVSTFLVRQGVPSAGSRK